MQKNRRDARYFIKIYTSSQCSVEDNLKKNILGEEENYEKRKDTGDNDDHFYVVPSEKINWKILHQLLYVVVFWVGFPSLGSVRVWSYQINPKSFQNPHVLDSLSLKSPKSSEAPKPKKNIPVSAVVSSGQLMLSKLGRHQLSVQASADNFFPRNCLTKFVSFCAPKTILGF